MSQFTTGQTIARRYRVVKRLGAGAFGAVYLVDDLDWRGKQFALKVLHLGFDPEKDEARIQRFRDEADKLLSLVHPSIVQIRGYVEFEGMCCYAMDYVEGRTLGDLVRDEGRLEPARALALCGELLEALEAAHAVGIVHRDVKPENVIVADPGTDREQAKVLDFGIAKALDGATLGLTGPGAIGTPAYMSPEQGRGKKGSVDARSDVYSAGCVLFELLIGRPPFESESAIGFMVQHELAEVPAFAEVAPDLKVPEGVETVVRRALEKDPADRFPSALAMMQAIEGLERVSRPGARVSGASLRRSRVQRAAAGAAEPDLASGAAPSGEVTGAASPAALPLGPPPPAAAAIELTRARVDLDPDSRSAPFEALFVIGGPSLRFGRSRPGQVPSAEDNSLILRVLPCRSRVLDPVNFDATKRISGSHGRIELRDGVLWLCDTSTFGTWLDGERVPRGEAVRLPVSFQLELSEVLALEGRVLLSAAPGDAEPTPPGGLLLTRPRNRSEHAYLWVIGAVALGGGEGASGERGAAVPLAEGLAGRIEAGAAGLRLWLPEGLTAKPARVGDEVR